MDTNRMMMMVVVVMPLYDCTVVIPVFYLLFRSRTRLSFVQLSFTLQHLKTSWSRVVTISAEFMPTPLIWRHQRRSVMLSF